MNATVTLVGITSPVTEIVNPISSGTLSQCGCIRQENLWVCLRRYDVPEGTNDHNFHALVNDRQTGLVPWYMDINIGEMVRYDYTWRLVGTIMYIAPVAPGCREHVWRDAASILREIEDPTIFPRSERVAPLRDGESR